MDSIHGIRRSGCEADPSYKAVSRCRTGGAVPSLHPTLHDVHSSDVSLLLNPLTPNSSYSGRTAPLTSKRCILYISSTNIGTEYFKNGVYSPFFSSSKCSLFHNSNLFCSCIIQILYTGCAKIKKKIIPAPKG